VRLLMLSDAVGGVWTYTVELVSGLAGRGWSVAVVTMGSPPRDDQREEILRIPGVKLNQSTFPLEWERPEAEQLHRAGEWLLRLERELAPDLIHLNSYAQAALPWTAPVVVAGHSCVLSWHEAVRKEAAPSDWDLYAERVATGIRSADTVVAPSAAMLIALERWYGVGGPSCVIPNGRDPGCVAPLQKDRYILSSGRLWDEAKNLGVLAAVAPELQWPVMMAGPVLHESMGAFAPDQVRLLGDLSFPKLRGWLARAPIFALPALYEPFGFGPLEAGLAGCALVLGDIPSLREVWEGAALYVDPRSQPALTDAIGSLIRDPGLMSEMGRRARARALHFSPAQMTDRYIHLYAGLTTAPVTSVGIG
jgi:glycogen synthase